MADGVWGAHTHTRPIIGSDLAQYSYSSMTEAFTYTVVGMFMGQWLECIILLLSVSFRTIFICKQEILYSYNLYMKSLGNISLCIWRINIFITICAFSLLIPPNYNSFPQTIPLLWNSLLSRLSHLAGIPRFPPNLNFSLVWCTETFIEGKLLILLQWSLKSSF